METIKFLNQLLDLVRLENAVLNHDPSTGSDMHELSRRLEDGKLRAAETLDNLVDARAYQAIIDSCNTAEQIRTGTLPKVPA